MKRVLLIFAAFALFGTSGVEAAVGVDVERAWTSPDSFVVNTPADAWMTPAETLSVGERLDASHEAATSTQAAEAQRERSRTQHKDLGQKAIVELLRRIFPEALALFGDSPTDPISEADRVLTVLSNNTALVDPEGPQSKAIVDSIQPLFDHHGQAFDTSIEPDSVSGFADTNSPTPIALPKKADGQFALEGILSFSLLVGDSGR